MSIWAEIKKAINSNLNLPLNELIDKYVEEERVPFISRNFKTSIAIFDGNPMFSITNPKGGQINSLRFPELNVPSNNNSKVAYVVSCDDVDVIRIVVSMNNTSAYDGVFSSIDITDTKYLSIYTDGNSNYSPSFSYDISNGTVRRSYNSTVINYSLSEENTIFYSTATAYDVAFIPLNRPIKFKNRVDVKIEVLSGTVKESSNKSYSNYTGSVNYTLY